jgi:prevent-host-death family protein
VVPCVHMATRPRIGIRKLRENLTATIRRVRSGEAIEITHDGAPVALLSPLPSGRIGRLLAAGDVSATTPLERPLRRFAVTGPVTASEALEEDRAER